MYRGILERCLVKSAEKLNLPRDWIFQQDNDPKHTDRATLNMVSGEGHRVIGMAKPIT
jgi:hypothetical protein